LAWAVREARRAVYALRWEAKMAGRGACWAGVCLGVVKEKWHQEVLLTRVRM